jgi:hypothetical protein
MLRDHKIRSLEMRPAGNITPTTLVFGTIEGQLVRPRNLSKAWWRVRLLRYAHAASAIEAPDNRKFSPVPSGAFCFPISCGLSLSRLIPRSAAPYTWKERSVRGGQIVDLIEGLVGLVTVILLLACVGKISHTLARLEKRERHY